MQAVEPMEMITKAEIQKIIDSKDLFGNYILRISKADYNLLKE